MRTAFIEQLCACAAADERIWLVCGDLGYSVLEVFANQFPRRYLNAGVAEQNMTGIAAGIAMTGKIVFTYSIANFPVIRCLEQIRTDICYHNLNVKIVAVGGGLAYGAQGYTHHGVEDLGVMRCLPNMQVVAPGDPVETRAAVPLLVSTSGPAYLRLGKAGEPVLHDGPVDLRPGCAIPMRAGNRATIISTGGVLGITLEAAGDLEAGGLSVAVISMPWLVPIDREAILRAAKDTGHIVTVEEHGPGGLGTAVAEILAESSVTARLTTVRLRHEILRTAGSQSFLRSALGVSREKIVDAVRGFKPHSAI